MHTPTRELFFIERTETASAGWGWTNQRRGFVPIGHFCTPKYCPWEKPRGILRGEGCGSYWSFPPSFHLTLGVQCWSTCLFPVSPPFVHSPTTAVCVRRRNGKEWTKLVGHLEEPTPKCSTHTNLFFITSVSNHSKQLFLESCGISSQEVLD